MAVADVADDPPPPSGGGVSDPNGNLASLAALTLAANKGLMSTAAGTAATFDLSAAALTVLDDASVAAMLATMGGAPLASPTFTGTVTAGALVLTAAAVTTVTDAATTTSTLLESYYHAASGTPAAGFGGHVNFDLASSTGVQRTAASHRVKWTVATNGGETVQYNLALMTSGTLQAAGSESYSFGASAFTMRLAGAAVIDITGGGGANIDFQSLQILSNTNTTITTPGISFRTDGNTGIGYVGADNFRLIAGGLAIVEIATVTAARRLALYGGTPVIQPVAAGTVAFTANASANALFVESTSTGGTGASAYTFPDIVLALKQINAIAQ